MRKKPPWQTTLAEMLEQNETARMLNAELTALRGLRSDVAKAIVRSEKSAPKERDNISRNTLVEDLYFALHRVELSTAKPPSKPAPSRCESVSNQGLRCALKAGHNGKHHALGQFVT